MKQVVKEKSIEIVIALITIFVSVVLAIYAATYSVKQESKKGEAILQEIGFRYFFNFYRAFDSETGSLRQDDVSKNIYLEELKSILSTIDGLSVNPSYLSRAKNSTSLPLLASEVRAEIVQGQYSKGFSIRTSATLLMCKLYLDSSLSQVELPNQDGEAQDIKVFGIRVCEHLGQG